MKHCHLPSKVLAFSVNIIENVRIIWHIFWVW